MSTDETTDDDGKTLEFEDTVAIDGTKNELWAFISQPENLVDCVPGAQDIERLSEREYTFVIEQSIGNFSAVFDGDVELVEMNEPDWIVADGSAYDRGTGSTFDVLAAMEMNADGESGVELAYSADVAFTGGVAAYAATWIRRVVSSRVDEYFANIKAEFEGDDDEEVESFA
ncbi:MAG: SRPBCC domain-containing protein [Halobacteriales archaeon]